MLASKNKPLDAPVPTLVQPNLDAGLPPERRHSLRCEGNFDTSCQLSRLCSILEQLVTRLPPKIQTSTTAGVRIVGPEDPARPANQTQGVHMSSPGGQKRSDDKLPPRQTAPSDVERTRSKAQARGSEKKNGQIANAVSSRQLSDVKIGSIMSVATGAHRQEPTVRCPAAQQARGGTILAPSQIKQEIDLDDIIIVSPPREMMEEEADGGPDFGANVNRFNLENAQAK
ncbi:unnamed protein product, partial [Nesidiocoris tenuis]